MEYTWNDIEQHIAACTRCPLCKTRNRPVMGRGSHQAACFPYLKYETFLLKPKIIVCLGRVAAPRIILPDFKITRQHGTWTYRKNCALTATYHPSSILKDPSKYELARKDFYEIVGKLSQKDP